MVDETPDQRSMREFYTARGVVCAWGRDKSGNYFAPFARDSWAAWQEAKRSADQPSAVPDFKTWREHELRYVCEAMRDISRQNGEAARESANDVLAWAENRLRAADNAAAAPQPSPARDDARDAARYRWLVENAKHIPWSRQFPGLHAGKGLDDAIDKAIADSTEGSEL